LNVKPALFVIGSLVVLGILYAVFKPQQPSQPQTVQQVGKPTPPSSTQAPPVTSAAPAPGAGTAAPPVALAADPSLNTLDVTVRNGRRVSEPAVLKVKQGDEVTLNVNADVADELHLHGYDRRLKLIAGQTATLQFNAKLTGRFTFELHKSGRELGAIEVYPR